MLAIALEQLSMLDEEVVVAEDDSAILEEDSSTLDDVMASLEVASVKLLSLESEVVELSIDGSRSSVLQEDSGSGFTALELSLSPHAEMRIPNINIMQAKKIFLLEMFFI